MTQISFDKAARFVEAHGFLAQQASQPGMIQVRLEYAQGGVVGVEWETIPCTAQAVRDWLGY